MPLSDDERRWIDGIKDRVDAHRSQLDDHADQLEALARMPERMRDLLEDIRREVTGDVKELRRECRENFAQIHKDHAETAPARFDLRTWITWVGTILIPVLAFYLAAKGMK